MSGYSVDIDLLRAASADLDERLNRAGDLIREIDSLAVPTQSFGGIGQSVASTYSGLHQRKVAAMESIIARLRDAGWMTSAVADMYQVRDNATADALARFGQELA
jgi:uncharacterized protein YukE